MPQAPVEYMQGNSRGRNLGARAFSEFEDPGLIRNPYHLELEAANADVRTRRARADQAEFAASPERQRVDRVQQQLDADYDLEYRAPNRVDMMGKLGISQAEDEARGKRRAGEIESEGYFDDWTTRQRENERGFKREQFDLQYSNPARARMYDSELDYRGRVDTAGINAGARRDTARTGAQARVRGDMVDDMGQVTQGNEGRVGQIDQNLGISDGKPFPASRFADYVATQFGGDAAAAEEHLASRGYYIDQDR